MHANSNTDFQDPIPVITSTSKHVSSNRIKIQVILLILQLETDYFSSYSFQKCSIQSSGTTVFTETSRTAILHEEVLQDSSAPILQGYPHTTYKLHTRVHMHPENSPSRIQFYMQKTESSSSTTTTYRGQKRPSFQKRNSTHRRQGDLLEIHPVCPTRPSKDIPGIPATRPSKGIPDIPDIPDIPVIYDLPAFQAILQVPVLPGFPPHYNILQLECIFYIFYNFYSLISFHRKLHRVPVGQYKRSTNIHSSKKGRCCDISQN